MGVALGLVKQLGGAQKLRLNRGRPFDVAGVADAWNVGVTAYGAGRGVWCVESCRISSAP